MIGIDLIEISRIQRALEKYGETFLQRIFTPREQAELAQKKNLLQTIAGRFAAKEAIAKALGCGFGKALTFHDIEILRAPSGEPIVHCRGKRIALSISHTRALAIAIAMIL